jgi:hypothetical protein
MRRVLGIVAIFLAALVGLVEFRAIANPAVAETMRITFAAYDPFPRLPWDHHVTFILLFPGAAREWTSLRFQAEGAWHVSPLTNR